MVLVLVTLAFIGLWVFDVHKTIFVKLKARDGGDAAAVAAARWQGICLNLAGDLNLHQAALISDALARGEPGAPELAAVEDLRARLVFLGPLIGMNAAQQAAKNNGLYSRDAYARELEAHAADVEAAYAVSFSPPYGEESGEPVWEDYAAMLRTIAAGGVAAMPENPAWFVDYMDWSHWLLNPNFYDALAAGDWCWFLHHAMGLLAGYGSWMDWHALPELARRLPVNAELFSLHLIPVTTAASLPVLDPEQPDHRIGDFLDAAEALADRPFQAGVVEFEAVWHAFDPGAWTPWSAFIPEGFPFATGIREAYDAVGADAAVRVAARTERRTPGIRSADIQWTAAAKPFGALPDDEPAPAFGLVLPVFTDARLIPVDTSTAPAAGSEAGWAEHIYGHLPDYVSDGPGALHPGCFYCRQLAVWEEESVRQAGMDWLEEHGDDCVQPRPGAGPGGGARRGH
jgi:hypothetical protein